MAPGSEQEGLELRQRRRIESRRQPSVVSGWLARLAVIPESKLTDEPPPRWKLTEPHAAGAFPPPKLGETEVKLGPFLARLYCNGCDMDPNAVHWITGTVSNDLYFYHSMQGMELSE